MLDITTENFMQQQLVHKMEIEKQVIAQQSKGLTNLKCHVAA